MKSNCAVQNGGSSPKRSASASRVSWRTVVLVAASSSAIVRVDLLVHRNKLIGSVHHRSRRTFNACDGTEHIVPRLVSAQARIRAPDRRRVGLENVDALAREIPWQFAGRKCRHLCSEVA